MSSGEFENPAFKQAFIDPLAVWRENGSFDIVSRMQLADLPFNGRIDGQVSFLAPVHKQMLDDLVEKSRSFPIQIFKISGYASALGSEDANKTLSQNRANAVFVYLQEAIKKPADSPAQIQFSLASDAVEGRGEPGSLYPYTHTNFGSDFPLDRRVEVDYIISKSFQVPLNQRCGTLWKIGFDRNVSIYNTFGGEFGVGTLTMDPDTVDEQVRQFFYFSLGVGWERSVAKQYEDQIKEITGRDLTVDVAMGKFQKAVEGTLKKVFKLTQINGLDGQITSFSAGGGFVTDECLTFSQMDGFMILIVGTLSGGFSIASLGISLLVGMLFTRVQSPDHSGTELKPEIFGTVIGDFGVGPVPDLGSIKAVVSVGMLFLKD